MRVRLKPVVLSFLSIAALVAGCDDAAHREAKYLKQGVKQFGEGQYEKARIEFKNAARINPTDPEVLYRVGLVDEAEGDLHNAFADFVHAEEQNARFAPAVLKLAQYFLAAERYDEVESRLTRVLTDQPDNDEAHALRGALLLRRGDYPGTESEARLALDKNPRNITAVSVLAGLYSAQGDAAKAGAVIEQGIAANPGNLALLQLKVAIYQKFDNLPKIEGAYAEIFKIRPADRTFRSELADIYRKAQRMDDAEATLRAGVKAAPDDWAMKQMLVSFLSDVRGLDAAEHEIRDYMAVAKNNDTLYFWLAQLYMKHNAVDRAVALLQQVAEKEKFETPGLTARASLAQISFNRGDRALAEQLVAVVLDKDPTNRAALYLRAGIAFDTGRYQAAVADLRTILREHPHASDALQLLGETLLRQGHLDLAIDTFNQLVETSPLDSAVRVRLAQMYHLNGDDHRALELVGLVTKADPSFPVGWETLARIDIDKRDWDGAEAAISKLETLNGQKVTGIFLRGQVMEATSKPDEAIRLFSSVVAADPNTPLAEHAIAALVAVYKKLGKLSAAASYLETLNTDNVFVSTVLGECYMELGKLDQAANTFDVVIARKAVRPEPYLDRSRLFLSEGKVEQALVLLKQGADLMPGEIRLPLMEADILSAQGRYQEAVAIYEDQLSRNPTLDLAANNLAELIADYEYNDPAALEKARKVAERFASAKDPLLLDTLGWVYYRLGNIPQALIYTERAAESGNAPAQVHYHFGAVLAKSSRGQEAKVELERSLMGKQDYPGKADAKAILQSL